MSTLPRVRLSDIADSITYGVTASASLEERGPKFLRITDIQNGHVDWQSVPWCECDEKEASAAQLRTGDIVFARTGATTGKSFLIRECPSNAVFASYLIRVRFGSEAEPRYISHFFQTQDYWTQITKSARGVAQPGVNATTLKSLSVPLPPLAEQRRIAGILDKAEGLRAKRRAALAKIDILPQAIFLELFGDPATNPKGWPVAPFPSVVYFQEGPGVRNWQFRNEGIKLINVKNIVEGKLVVENTERYLSADEVEQRYKHFLLDAGDFVVASSGVTWGKIAEVLSEHLPLCLNTSMIRLRPLEDEIDKQFIRAFVESFSFRKQILRLITGSAQPNFGPAHLKQVKIPLPPIELQREFARRVSAVEKLKAAQRASLAKLDALFASVQYRAFRGEL